MAKSGKQTKRRCGHLPSTSPLLLWVAFLAPWLWYLGQYLIAADILPQLKPFGFAKYLNRAVLILVIVGLWPFLKHVGMSDREQFGIVPNPNWRRDLWVGLAVALAILLACGLVGVG